MWLKTRSGYAINMDHIVSLNRTNESGTYYIKATLLDASTSDLPGAYASENDVQEAIDKLTKSFDASLLVP